MKIYTRECMACQEPWVYIRLTRREVALLVAEAPAAGRVLPKIVTELKKYPEPA